MRVVAVSRRVPCARVAAWATGTASAMSVSPLRRGVGAGGAVGDEADVDAGGLGPAAPVAVVPVEGRGGAAVDLLQREGAGAGADRVDGALRRRPSRTARRGSAGQPQRQDRVGPSGGDADPVPVDGLGGERHAGQGGRGAGLARAAWVRGGGDGLGGDCGAVLEGGLAQGELPAAAALWRQERRGRGGGALPLPRAVRPSVTPEPAGGWWHRRRTGESRSAGGKARATRSREPSAEAPGGGVGGRRRSTPRGGRGEKGGQQPGRARGRHVPQLGRSQEAGSGSGKIEQ